MTSCAVITFVTYLAYQQLFMLIQSVYVSSAVLYNSVKNSGRIRDVREWCLCNGSFEATLFGVL